MVGELTHIEAVVVDAVGFHVVRGTVDREHDVSLVSDSHGTWDLI